MALKKREKDFFSRCVFCFIIHNFISLNLAIEVSTVSWIRTLPLNQKCLSQYVHLSIHITQSYIITSSRDNL